MQINEGITNILCDCPGHFYSNGFIRELNNAFLINQLFQRINNHDLRIKLLVVISFDDIRSRRCETVEQTFVQIEKMFNNNIGELRNGIGLVITKARPNMHAEAILNSMKNNTDGILKSWCDYFLQNQCQHVFLFSEPSFEDVDDLYSTFLDKENIKEFINDYNFDLINPPNTISLSEQAKDKLNCLIQNQLNQFDNEVRNMFAVIISLYNQQNDINNLNHLKVFFNNLSNEEFDTISQFQSIIQNEIQIDQSQYDFTNIIEIENICRIACEIMQDEQYRILGRLMILHEHPYLCTQINTCFEGKVHFLHQQEQITNIQNQNEVLQGQYTNLQSQCANFQNQNVVLQGRCTSVQNQNENLQKQYANLQSQCDDTKNENSNLQKTIISIQKKNDDLNKNYEDIQKTNKNLENKISQPNRKKIYSNVLSAGAIGASAGKYVFGPIGLFFGAVTLLASFAYDKLNE